jgi:flagellar hook-associated protein 1 FlgK
MAINFIGLNTAVSGMNSNQKSLEVTGHNISNLGTLGFTRQQAVLQTAHTRYVANSWVEMGAAVQEIRQIRHTFLDNIYRREVNALGYWEARMNGVKDLEAILGEPILDGLQSALNEFWDSWQELAKQPDSLTVRALVRQRGEALVYHMNHMGSQINKLQDDINTEIIKRIDEVNQITAKIAELNVTIAKAEVAGNRANDYYDQRNNLVDQLSKLVSAEVREHPDGQMDIIVGGYYLVSKAQQTNIVPSQNAALSHYIIPKVEGLDVQINVGEGAIKGLMEARGMVSGAKGSYDNGTPNTTADITIAVDVSNLTPGYLENLQNNIESYLYEIKTRGLDYNLRLVAYNGSGVVFNENYGTDETAFIDALGGLTGTGVPGQGFEALVTALSGANPFREDANRYVFVFTDQGIAATKEQAKKYRDLLKENNIKVSVATDPSVYETGDPEAPGWNAITKGTGGVLYDITTDAADYPALLSRIGIDTGIDVNKVIATVDETLDIVSSVKKMLNAIVNIVAREVNRLQLSGKNLRGEDGGVFFEPIEPSLPMEMGNIRVALAMKDLNNIAASATDANGDNQIALAVAHLRNESLMEGYSQTLSIDDYYQYIILRVGNMGRDAEQIAANQQTLVYAADNDRQSIMGVSLDEEMSNMIKFKYAYNAATKTISVINEMLDTLINRTGITGR